MPEFLELYVKNPADREMPKSELAKVFKLGIEMIQNSPKLSEMIVADQDAVALEKKKLRQLDSEWQLRQGSTSRQEALFGTSDEDPTSVLRTKRRMPPEVVMIFFLLRSHLGDIKSYKSQIFIQESKTVDFFMTLYGYDKVPGSTTILENLNCLSTETHDCLLKETARIAKKKAHDKMEKAFVDSTRIEANSTWPTEAKTILALLQRFRDDTQRLRSLGLCVNLPKDVSDLLQQAEKAAKAIALGMGAKDAAKKRKKEYRKIISTQKTLHAYYAKALFRIECKLMKNDLKPSIRLRAENIMEQMKADLHNVQLCAENAKTRVLKGGKVAPKEKVLGVSEPDAEIISKGRTAPVFGYKPQIARSQKGFILAVIVPEGAASDSSMAVNTVKACIETTEVIPKVVSFDDGYASNDNFKEIHELGVDLVSFSGAKGKKITPKEQWDSKKNLKARNQRSTVESTMAVLKRDFGKDRLSRRGIDAVTQELKSVAIFHNLRLIFRLDEKKKEEINTKQVA